MKNIIAISLLLLSFTVAKAQLEIDRSERLLLDRNDSIAMPESKWSVGISGGFYYNSNSITNSFINSLAYQRTFIDEQKKDNETNRLKKNNRVGVDGSASLYATYNSAKLKYSFGIGQRVFAAGRFPKDLFEVAFRGNAAFAGKDANLTKTSILYVDYQNYFFGVQKELKEGKATIGASVAYLRAGHLQSFEMQNTTLFTEEYGQYIDLNGDLSYQSAGSENKGNGASVNLYYSILKNNNRLNFEVRDIGFIHWKNTKSYTGDSTYRYDGLLINDLLGSENSIIDKFALDSIATATGINVSTKNVTIMLPTIFHVNYVMSPNKRFSRTIGVRYMMAKGYIPKIYIREADFLGKGFTLVNTLSYGGFGRFDYELGLMKKINNSFIISANLFAFEYLVLPKKSSGNGVSVGLIKMF